MHFSGARRGLRGLAGTGLGRVAGLLRLLLLSPCQPRPCGAQSRSLPLRGLDGAGAGSEANRGAGGAEGGRGPRFGAGGIAGPGVGWAEWCWSPARERREVTRSPAGEPALTQPPRIDGADAPRHPAPAPRPAAMGLQRCPSAGEAPPSPPGVPARPPSPALPLPEAFGARLEPRAGVPMGGQAWQHREPPRSPQPRPLHPSPIPADSTGGKTAAWVVTGGQLGCHGGGGRHCSHEGAGGGGKALGG